MSATHLDQRKIDYLRNIPDLLPVRREHYENWSIKVINREEIVCKNYLSPNRRDFYKIIFINEGKGIFTLGLNTYHIDQPTILFVHPNEIISWKNLGLKSASTGYFCIFKRSFTDKNVILKSAIEKYELFSPTAKSVIQLPKETIITITQIFKKMHREEQASGPFMEDALQLYLQLIMVESCKAGHHQKAVTGTNDYKQVHDFFHLLEQETSGINYENPIRMKTAKEFAGHLAIHPNHLNALLKKQTGQNVSTHIKNRLLEEGKILLLQTDWPLQQIGYAIGFAEQPNFSHFFKKNIGITPIEFRKSQGL
ncbi:AraC family transcriptional regulator [Pedobacter hartonius]|uniref:AraC-type DNA-binding protein n=1 Tax=Pedobacter hartonius TaxID=425514 RepID=A0A1H4BAG3_9SPHI|nr:AraC family transcriptional regulator [Pedobacter hartonius]SEA44832.1 AraC-type DNA-binding protein [Pedobacter hartonius]